DIAERTQGDIYIGVVGPVRTGKSTFIKKFMENMVIPNISNEFAKERANDELPQSAAGRTIMTTEPKFVPAEAVNIRLDENISSSVKLIDCVGYIVPSALGHIENDEPRMVMTPWFENTIPFNAAAEIGTQKVIKDHSTIGLVVTTDGSIGEIPRTDYIEAEKRVISELKELEKPFVVLMNTIEPKSNRANLLCTELSKEYNVPVIPVDCLSLDEETINGIMKTILYEFPVKEVNINIPQWITLLNKDHWLKKSIIEDISTSCVNIQKIRQVQELATVLCNNEYILDASVSSVELGKGSVEISAEIPQILFYKILGETTGVEVSNDKDLFNIISDLSQSKKNYDKIASAMNEAECKGYGIVTPTIDELSLDEPEIMRQGSRYGVKLKASAPSYHIIKADIETEVAPIVGSEKQSEDLIKFLLTGFEDEPKKIWESNIFGKSLHELVNEGLNNKLNRMPDDARDKMQETLQKIINEGSGGLICIIL
ncbi:MAG: stage IV sporulation protein A, partial [Clostridia bacterium]|nr:stage IV sporulation protein A [Clostridia bacterium]